MVHYLTIIYIQIDRQIPLLYIHRTALNRYSGILQGFCQIRYPQLFFLNYGQANLKKHFSAAASEGCNCLVFCQLLTMIFLRPLINSCFCINLITLQNFVLTIFQIQSKYSKLYKFLDLLLLFYLLLDNQVIEFFKEFRNGYFGIVCYFL